MFYYIINFIKNLFKNKLILEISSSEDESELSFENNSESSSENYTSSSENEELDNSLLILYRETINQIIISKKIIIPEKQIQRFNKLLFKILKVITQKGYHFPEHNYLIYQILYQIKNNYDIRVYFKINEKNKNIVFNDQIWKNICDELDLKFNSLYSDPFIFTKITYFNIKIHEKCRKISENKKDILIEMFKDIKNSEYIKNMSYDFVLYKLIQLIDPIFNYNFECKKKDRLNDYYINWKKLCKEFNFNFIKN